jgi:hypothetical protein
LFAVQCGYHCVPWQNGAFDSGRKFVDSSQHRKLAQIIASFARGHKVVNLVEKGFDLGPGLAL